MLRDKGVEIVLSRVDGGVVEGRVVLDHVDFAAGRVGPVVEEGPFVPPVQPQRHLRGRLLLFLKSSVSPEIPAEMCFHFELTNRGILIQFSFWPV